MMELSVFMAFESVGLKVYGQSIASER
ncbi:hypothetical protein L204_102448 [Cryptococcus depauperatus]